MVHENPNQLSKRRDAVAKLAESVSLFAFSSMIIKPNKVIAETQLAPVVTQKVYFDIRIIQDYNNQVLEDSAIRGRLVFGLYGAEAPKTVEQFLRFVRGSSLGGTKTDDEEATVFPSYSSGLFTSNQQGRYLEGGKISGLVATEVPGVGRVYEWLGRAVSGGLPPALEPSRLRHDRRGLLSHSRFSGGPEFAISLGPAPELDSGWTVFGEVLSGQELVDAMAQLPYDTGRSVDPEGSLTDNLWRAQRDYFVSLAKQLGDTRVSNRFPGKLLRRVEIFGCGVEGSAGARGPSPPARRRQGA